MIGRVPTCAIAAAAMAEDAAERLRIAAHRDSVDSIELAAAECAERFLRAAVEAMDIAGILDQPRSARVRDVLAAYLMERTS